MTLSDKTILLCVLIGMGTDDESLIKQGFTKKDIELAKSKNKEAEQRLWREKNDNK